MSVSFDGMNQQAHEVWFTTTQWTVVLSAGGEQASEALETLCRRYWYPVYAFIRRKGVSADDAQDAVQGFFLSIFQRQSLKNVSRDRGRFRSFLMGAVNHYLADEYARATAQKRGAGRRPIELDGLDPEDRYRMEPSVTTDPAQTFDRRWALTVLDRAVERLEQDYRDTGRGDLFDAIHPLLTSDPLSGSYAGIAARLKMSEGSVKTAVHRLRRRYREFCREEVAQTVAEPSDVESELRYLCEILCENGGKLDVAS